MSTRRDDRSTPSRSTPSRSKRPMEPPPGFLEAAVKRGLEEARREEQLDEEPTWDRRDSGFFSDLDELDEGPPTLPFIRTPCG
jgi:hypothetical protein